MARVLGDVLGRLADQERERDERDRGEDEQDRLAGVERVPAEEDDGGEPRKTPRSSRRPTGPSLDARRDPELALPGRKVKS